MRLLSSLRHLGERKHRQAELALVSADEHAAVATAKRDEAQTLRRASENLLDDSIVANEHGLSRAQLFSRLRTLAVARAHVLESNHRAGVLDTEAAQNAAHEWELRKQSAEYRRKGKKIAEWSQRQTRASALKSARREEREIQEDYACRRR